MERNKELDVVRGICIILMVVGHSGFIYKDYIYLFHMAAFFILSGYLYKEKYSESIKNVIIFVKRRLLSLWFPCFAWQTIFILLNNIFIELNIYTNNPDFILLTPGSHKVLSDYMSVKEILVGIGKSFLFLGGTQMGGVFWFFLTLFVVSIMYCVVDYCINIISTKKSVHMWIQIIVSILLLLIGYFKLFPINIPNRVCSCYCLFNFGRLINSHKSMISKIKSWHWIVIACFSAIALFGLGQLGHISLNINHYENPLFLLISSMVGWCLVYSIGHIIVSCNLTIACKIIQILGEHTVAIASLHFLAFKIVSAIQLIVYSKPSFLLASFPVMYGDHFWWIAYSVVGVTVPCFAGIEYHKIKKKIGIGTL